MNEAIRNYIPVIDADRILRFKCHKRKLPKNVVEQCRTKNKLWKKFIRTRDNNIFAEFKNIRNKLRKSINKIKEAETLKLAKKIKTNPKVFWQHINKNRNCQTKLEYMIKTDINGSATTITCDVDMANCLAEFFKSVYISNDSLEISPTINNNIIVHIMEEVIINKYAVENKINKLNKYKSAGPDNIFSRVLIECKNSISSYLSNLYNKSLQAQMVPDDWKYTIITPVYKKGDKNTASNYRPVSLSCICCKLLESLIKDELIIHFDRNKLLDYRQYGFTRGKSTTIQLLKLMDMWSSALDKGETIDVVYTDFEKAFDRVSHAKLIDKLENYGVNGGLINWIKDYLTNRTSSVRVNNSTSNRFKVTSGVPQGSVLGPLLYIIYVNDMFEIVKNNSAELFMYADDAKIFKTIKSSDDRLILQSCLNSLGDWSKKWEIKLNAGKCVAVRYGRQLDDRRLYNIEGVELNFLDKIKDLGVTFQSSLTFVDHIYEIIKKCFSLLGIISRNFKDLTKDSFILIYKALVRSRLEYAVSVWSPWKKKDIEAIERVQKRATKMVKACKGLKYEDRLRILKLPCLKYRRLRGDLIMLYNFIQDKEGRLCFPNIKISEERRTRGHKFKLETQRFNGNCRKYFFLTRSTAIWNNLPSKIIEADQVNEFKRLIDCHFEISDIMYNYKKDF